jgi:hypothetical protein
MERVAQLTNTKETYAHMLSFDFDPALVKT